MRLGVFQETSHLRTYDGVDSIERTEHHYIVFVYFWIGKVELVVGMVFIEDIFRVVFVVEKSQRKRRFAVLVDVDIGGVYIIFLKEAYYPLSDTVVACLADERGADARPSQ